MLIAYADPPYIGQADHYKNEPEYGGEVDHRVLIDYLKSEFDAWALSVSSPSLQYILSICPPDVRVGSWVKPFAAYKVNVNPAYTWEPVIFYGGRKRTRQDTTVRDSFIHNITLKKGLIGAKPLRFAYWIFDLLGARPGDEFFDLYPGTGIMTQAWETYRSQEIQATLFAT